MIIRLDFLIEPYGRSRLSDEINVHYKGTLVCSWVQVHLQAKKVVPDLYVSSPLWTVFGCRWVRVHGLNDLKVYPPSSSVYGAQETIPTAQFLLEGEGKDCRTWCCLEFGVLVQRFGVAGFQINFI